MLTTNFQPTNKNQEIERLRAVAALMVALFHFLRPVELRLPAAFMHSWAGVELFFVISGYVITLSLARLLPDSALGTPLGDRLRAAGQGLKVFYMRRALRILPMAYFVALLFFLIITLLRIDTEVVVKGHIPGVTRAYRVNFDTISTEIIAVLTFTYNYVITRHPFQILVPYWSLSVEEHFYLFLPLCYVLLGNDKSRLRFAVFGVLFIAFIARPFEPFPNWSEEYQRFASHHLFDYLFAGVALGLLHKAGVGGSLLRRRGPGFTIAMNLLALALLIGQFVEPGIDPEAHVSNFTHFFLLINSVALVFLASAGQDYVLGLRGCRRALEYLGSRSYGIYLIHWFINCLAALFHPKLAQIPGATTSLGKVLELAVLFGISLALTELCFRFLERPFIEYGLRLTSLRPAPPFNPNRQGSLDSRPAT